MTGELKHALIHQTRANAGRLVRASLTEAAIASHERAIAAIGCEPPENQSFDYTFTLNSDRDADLIQALLPVLKARLRKLKREYAAI